MINIAFSKYVKMNGRLWEVNFRKLTRGNNLFYADTATLQGERITFEMQLEEGKGWMIRGSQVPEWMYGFSKNMGEAIDQGMMDFAPALESHA